MLNFGKIEDRAVGTAVLVPNGAVPAFAYAAFHHALQRHVDMFFGKSEPQEFFHNETVHNGRTAQDGIGVCRRKGRMVEQPGDHSHILLPDAFIIPVDAVEILDVFSVEKAQELVLEQYVVRAVGSIHKYEITKFASPVQHIEKKRTKRCEPQATCNEEKVMTFQCFYR